ncbi:MAG: P1 family peptidase [Chloroflexota bacterium]
MPDLSTSPPIRARDLQIPLDGTPGALNAITDVPGVEVGHTTLIEGDNVRTGVTVVLPRGRQYDPVFAGSTVLNGNGEMTGTIWVEESGFLEGAIAITNTHSVGVVRDALIAWQVEHQFFNPIVPGVFWGLPVVAETYDGALNEINGFHVKQAHVFAALDSASGGAVAEGAVGGGTGMICHGFKGGIGTASRRLDETGASPATYTVGVLVQANHGKRRHFTVAGVPVGKELTELPVEIHPIAPPPGVPPSGIGSIIVILATDAPLLPHQLKRLARRIPLGITRVGALGDHSSGDIFMAFSTANPGTAQRSSIADLKMLAQDALDPLFEATVQATEEAILNALVAAKTMVGRNGNTAHALPHERLQAILARYGRLAEDL